MPAPVAGTADAAAMIRLLLVDDHIIFREGVKQVLLDTPDVRVVAEAVNGREALRYIEAEKLDAVVMDINMPDRSGLETLRQIRDLAPRLPVLILSMYPEEQYAIRVLKAGASGYLSKDAAPDNLVTAIRKVSGGGRYVSPFVAEQLAARVGGEQEEQPHDALSEREFQVFRLLAAGRASTDIADELSLSVKTVSTYRSRVLAKMGFNSNAELTRYALEHGLVE